MKKALITGITGQDGSYLAEFLLEKGYEVHGITRRASISNTSRIDHLIAKNAVTLHDGDLSDSSSLVRIIGIVQPDEIYNLAAQSHVQVSFDVPEYSGDVDAIGVLRILEAVRILGLTKKTKVYQASTSELFGKVEEHRQSGGIGRCHTGADDYVAGVQLLAIPRNPADHIAEGDSVAVLATDAEIGVIGTFIKVHSPPGKAPGHEIRQGILAT